MKKEGMTSYERPLVETVEVEFRNPITATSQCPLETEDVHSCDDDEA